MLFKFVYGSFFFDLLLINSTFLVIFNELTEKRKCFGSLIIDFFFLGKFFSQPFYPVFGSFLFDRLLIFSIFLVIFNELAGKRKCFGS